MWNFFSTERVSFQLDGSFSLYIYTSWIYNCDILNRHLKFAPKNISLLRVKNENMFEMHTMCKVAMSIIKLIFCRVIIIQLCISLSDQLVVGQKEGMPVCTTCNDEF